MSKMEDVRAQMVQAMKSGEKERKEALSMLLAALKAKFIDKREELTEEEVFVFRVAACDNQVDREQERFIGNSNRPRKPWSPRLPIARISGNSANGASPSFRSSPPGR